MNADERGLLMVTPTAFPQLTHSELGSAVMISSSGICVYPRSSAVSNF